MMGRAMPVRPYTEIEAEGTLQDCYGCEHTPQVQDDCFVGVD